MQERDARIGLRAAAAALALTLTMAACSSGSSNKTATPGGDDRGAVGQRGSRRRSRSGGRVAGRPRLGRLPGSTVRRRDLDVGGPPPAA